MKKLFVALIIVLLCMSINCYASNEEVLESQKDSLNISSFINEANQYSGDVLEDIDIGDLLNSAIKGQVDNSTLIKRILNLFGKEVIESITILR